MIAQANISKEVEREVEIRISPFVATILSAMATKLNGTADLKTAEIRADCGYMRLSLIGEDTIYVEALYIDKEKQGQGCGSMMLSMLEEIVSRVSLHTMYIRLWPVKSAIGFYLKNAYDLYVETSPEEEYIMIKKKKYGRGWKQYEAKTRMSINEEAGETNLWTHEMLYPLYENSGLMNDENPMFYSFYVSDIANGDYRYATKTVQPTRGTQMSMTV
jgi:GNAT superfamily N-acetyltransferase